MMEKSKEELEKENKLLKEILVRTRCQDRKAQQIINGFLKTYGFDMDIELIKDK